MVYHEPKRLSEHLLWLIENIQVLVFVLNWQEINLTKHDESYVLSKREDITLAFHIECMGVFPDLPSCIVIEYFIKASFIICPILRPREVSLVLEILELHQLVQTFSSLQEKMSKFASWEDNDLRTKFLGELRRLSLDVKENYETGLKLQEIEALTQNSRVEALTKNPSKD